MIKAAIIGGSGYVGGEVLRLLLSHLEVEVIAVTSHSNVGEKVSNIHQNLNKICDFTFQEEKQEKLAAEADVLFFTLPHGESMRRIGKLDLKKTKVIDLGADFRLKEAKLFKQGYGLKHLAEDKLNKAVYGLTEVNRDKIRNAQLIACPGCFSTASLLALHPLVKCGMFTKKVIIDAKTGSSGSGSKPTEVAHHPERAFDIRAYSIFSHRHLPEITQELIHLGSKTSDVIFTPHSTPIVRGIFITAYVFIDKKINDTQLKQIYSNTYTNDPFVRIVDSPRCAVVAGTNYCDLAVVGKENTIIVTCAIDNLVKGAAGQAIQNMNVMFGLSETLGLEFSGTHP